MSPLGFGLIGAMAGVAFLALSFAALGLLRLLRLMIGVASGLWVEVPKPETLKAHSDHLPGNVFRPACVVAVIALIWF